jgi:transposase-like protein
LSTQDIEAALANTLEVDAVSKSSVRHLCRQLARDFEQWQNRDLSEHRR